MNKLVKLIVVTLLLALPSLRADELVLKAGDRVVVYGDSITQQRIYSRYLQQYVQCRYPDLKVKFFNAGWSCDTAPGGLGRLERDVLWLKPTVVTVFYGMNDGGYRPVQDSIVARYRTGEEGIIKALQAKGVRVVVFTPGCIDPDSRKDLGAINYNQNLETLGKTVLDLAKQYDCPAADVFHPLVSFQTAQKAKQANFTIIPDGVHPNPPGHLVMAQAMLQGLGVAPMPALGAVDLAARQGSDLRVVSTTAGQTVLETTRPIHMPFWFDPAAGDVMRECGFLGNLAGQKLTVKSLAPGFYKLTIDGAGVGKTSTADGADAGKYSADQLAAGVMVPGTFSAAGKRIHDLIEQKENNYYTAWREVRLPLAEVTGVSQVVDGLMVANDGYETAINSLAQPLAKLTLTLTAAPEGPNLALKKTYECSDPNQYGWGVGGLTDGSWEGDYQHTFMSSDSTNFPKTVTINLEKPLKVGTILFGVPPFGSTKTVKVSVSADGKTFSEVGAHVFSTRKAEKAAVTFPPVEAMYVRLTYVDHYNEDAGAPPCFAFTSEVEVYAPSQAK